MKDMTKQSKLLNIIIGTVGEITVLVKYSPKRDQLMGLIQNNLEFDANDEGFKQATNLSKLCMTRWNCSNSTHESSHQL